VKRFLAIRNSLVCLILTALFGLVGFYLVDIWHASNLSGLSDHDYTEEINDLRRNGKIGEALAICNYVKDQPGMPNRDTIEKIGADIEREQASWLGKCKRFGSGFATGKIDSSEATVGTVVSDFLVIGDIRDLGIQGYHAAKGQEVDAIVVLLSGIGVLASASSFIPEPGEPAVAGADAGISLLKALTKIHAITTEFRKKALELGQVVLKTRKLGPFGELLIDVRSMAKAAPAGTLGTAMKEVKSVEDLKAVSRCMALAPNETITALNVGGSRAKDLIKTTAGISKKMLGKALRKGTVGLAPFRPYIRGAKFIYRGSLVEIRDQIIDWVENHPKIRKAFLALGACFLGLAAVFAISSVSHLYYAYTLPNSKRQCS